MERTKQEFTLIDRQEEAAEFYDYSWRRLRDQAVRGKVLGISYERGCGFIFHQDGQYEMVDSVPDIPTKFVLPRRTTHVAHEVCSGLVSGLIYQGELIARKHQHPEVELMAEPGCSGAIVKLLPLHLKS